MTNPTPEQIEAARAEYDRSEDMCAALVAAAGVAPQEPTSEQAWLVLLMPDSGAHKTREWRGISASEDDAIERAMTENPGWSVHTFGPDVNAKPGPVQVDEAKLAEVIHKGICGDPVCDFGPAQEHRDSARAVAEWLRGGG